MLVVLLQRAGPYVLIELVMPGGTLLALMLYLYQRRNQIDASRPGAIERMFDTMQPAFAMAAVPLAGSVSASR
jgi:hypothetical protein